MKTILDLYRVNRTTMRASDALRHARYLCKMQGADYPRYAGDDVRMELPHGESITMRLETDCDADVFERFSISRDMKCVSDDVCSNAHEGWINRDGDIVMDTRANSWNHRDWRYFASDYPLAQRVADFRKRGMSRHLAWLAARESLARDYDAFCEAMQNGYCGYIVTFRDKEGREIDCGCWGFEATDDCAGKEAYAVAQSMRDDRAIQWIEKKTQAHKDARHARTRFHNLARDFTAHRGDYGTAICEAIRAQHKAAISVIASN